MRSLRFLAVACVIAVAAPASLASAESAASGDPAGAVPADFVTLVDDTGALTVAVPSAWTDVDTTPGTNDDGTPMPWISASTDFAAYRETFDVPGMVFLGVTYTSDLQSWIDRLGQTDACGTDTVEPYDDGAFVGLDATFGQCGPNSATLRVIAANAGDDTSRTYVLQIQSPTAADLEDVEPILASFNAIGVTSSAAPDSGGAGPAAPAPGAVAIPDETTPPVAVTLPDGTPLLPALPPGAEGAPTTTGAVDAPPEGVFTPTNAVAPGAVQIADDSRTISVAVPPDWTQSSTAASAGGLPQIVASPDLVTFGAGGPASFTVPGVRYLASSYESDTAAAATGAAATLGCTAASPQPYSDPVFTGHIVQLTACGGTATRAYLVAASPASQTMTAVLYVQVTDFDDSDLQTVLSTFNVDPAAPAPSSSPTSATTSPTAPATTAAPATPSTSAAPSVFTPSVDFPADTVAIVDDSGAIRVGVPPSWTQRDTAVGSATDGSPVPHVAASPDLAAFLASPSTYATPGVLYQALPYTADAAGLVASAATGHDCTPGIAQDYRDSVFSGTIQELTACGGSASRVFLVAANPADQRFTALLTIVVTDDPAVLNTILATFDYDAAALAAAAPAG